MNEYRYEEIDLNNEHYAAEFEVQITAEMMNLFMIISGDNNPLHIDSIFAMESGYDDKVVYGMLTAALYSKLVGVYLPGKYCVLQRMDTHFHRPVYVGDSVKVSGEIKKKIEVGNALVVGAKIINQRGVVVNTAKIEVSCRI